MTEPLSITPDHERRADAFTTWAEELASARPNLSIIVENQTKTSILLLDPSTQHLLGNVPLHPNLITLSRKAKIESAHQYVVSVSIVSKTAAQAEEVFRELDARARTLHASSIERLDIGPIPELEIGPHFALTGFYTFLA